MDDNSLTAGLDSLSLSLTPAYIEVSWEGIAISNVESTVTLVDRAALFAVSDPHGPAVSPYAHRLPTGHRNRHACHGRIGTVSQSRM